MGTMKPLATGTKYDGRTILGVVESDLDDDYLPYLYELDDGSTVWIPAGSEP